jgi:hypothetical protein
MAPRYFASIMACARWETQYITEWLLYHRSIGFDHVYLYCNDDDPTDLYGEVLPFCRDERPFVTFRHFPYQGQQFYMMMHALQHHKDETEWVAFLDIDEFLVLPRLNDVKKFLGSCPAHWDALHFNWSFFGNNGHIERPSGSVLRAYTRREDRLHQSTKSLTRSRKIDLGRIRRRIYVWHGWDGVFGAEFGAVNVLGVPMDQVKGDDDGASYIKHLETQERIRQIAFVNHYAFKSSRDFELRVDRGLLGDFHGQAGWKRLAESGGREAKLRELNAVEDTYLSDYWTGYLGAVEQTRIVPRATASNVAIGKHAEQSSVGEWSHADTPAADASGALSGVITGGMQFCTAMESQPWWSVDLGRPHLIHEVRVFNRVDQPEFRARLGAFRIDISDAGAEWSSIYSNDGSLLVGGADGEPLILRLEPPRAFQRLRIVALGHTFLHLDQVELYGMPLGDPAALPAPAIVAGTETRTRASSEPIVHVHLRGLLANRMIEFMSGYAVASAVPGCRLSGVRLPEWGIEYPDLPPDSTRRVRMAGPPRMRIGRSELVRGLSDGEFDYVRILSYAQDLDNFPPKDVCAKLFVAKNVEVPRIGKDELLIHIRCDDVLHPVDPDYVLTPGEFYEDLVAHTGLKPVFMGQIGDNSFCRRLRERFPDAVFLPRQGVVEDIETLRRAQNIVTSVSTFAWIGAWLSNAEQIHMPLNGFLNPMQQPEVNLMPLDDPRYRFYLFPSNYAVPEQDWPQTHASMRGLWRLVTPDMIREMMAHQPRYGEALELIRLEFDEAHYLARNPDVRAVVESGGYKNGWAHYSTYGCIERRSPFPLDLGWYGRQYPIAAVEVGQGDFANFHHHYLAIGRRRGYLPLPSGQT